MIKTRFVDITDQNYDTLGEFPYNFTCNVGEFVDFTEFDPYSDNDVYMVKNVIHLPKEAVKIVELKQVHAGKIDR